MALILDTTVALAALDAADRDHVASAKLIAEEPEELIVPTLVLAELVERLGEPRLATLDHRHFDVMRPRHVKALELLPAGVKGRRSN